ncbi:MAG: hypothetical protein ACREN1_06520 [Candidatus Dormibacteria bacterium]
MPALRPRAGATSGVILLLLLLAACGGPAHSGRSPAPSPSPVMPGLLGLAGETTTPLLIAGPYEFEGTYRGAAKTVPTSTVPATPLAAVTTLVQDLGVPGPPLSTSTGLGYNLGSTEGYQLTTNASMTSFNFHPNTPTDEVGTTPTVAYAEQYADAFLSTRNVPAGGGVVPLPQLSTANGSDRTVFFQWTLDGLPVVNILGQPQEIYVDVARDQFQATQLVGISGAVPYGALGTSVTYPAMAPEQAVKYLNTGAIKPGRYLLSPSGRPLGPPSPVPTGPARLGSESTAIVVSFGTAVPVYLFQVVGNPSVTQFVTCAVPPAGCVPLRFSTASPTPSSSGGG